MWFTWISPLFGVMGKNCQCFHHVCLKRGWNCDDVTGSSLTFSFYKRQFFLSRRILLFYVHKIYNWWKSSSFNILVVFRSIKMLKTRDVTDKLHVFQHTSTPRHHQTATIATHYCKEAKWARFHTTNLLLTMTRFVNPLCRPYDENFRRSVNPFLTLYVYIIQLFVHSQLLQQIWLH